MCMYDEPNIAQQRLDNACDLRIEFSIPQISLFKPANDLLPRQDVLHYADLLGKDVADTGIRTKLTAELRFTEQEGQLDYFSFSKTATRKAIDWLKEQIALLERDAILDAPESRAAIFGIGAGARLLRLAVLSLSDGNRYLFPLSDIASLSGRHNVVFLALISHYRRFGLSAQLSGLVDEIRNPPQPTEDLL